jgi:transcription initiation factor TFIID subunit 8
MNISGRTSPTPQDFIVALNHFNLTPSKLEAYMEIPSIPSITQPSIPVDMSTDDVPAKLDRVLGPDLIISTSSEELRSIQTEQMRIRFRNFVPKHLPELPSMHTWRSTAVWATDRGENASEGQADARNVRERATKEGVMAEQALRRLLTTSKKGKKDGDDQGNMNVLDKKKSKVQTAWERAQETILTMDKDAREQEEAEEAAVAAEFDEPDPVLDVLEDALEPKAPPSWRKAKRMLEEEQRMEDEDEELTMVVNCDRKYWREGARGRH